jgi:dipeptidyl aminopeptidase/acylaminoacyl peptidase
MNDNLGVVMKHMLVVLFILSSAFAEKKAFDIEALYKLKGVADPQISANGKKIAFTVTQRFLEKGKSNSEIYICDADGSNLTQLTNNEAADYHPRWKNNHELMFLSTRSGAAQAWKISVNGGEATQLTHFSPGVSDAEWVPNKNELIFSSVVYPECGSNQECNEKLDESFAKGPLNAHYAKKLLYRHWTFYKDGKRTHLFHYDITKDEYKDITPGDYDSPAMWGGFSISPDGKFVAVESNRDEFEAETTNKDLYLINLKTLATRNLTDENEAYDGAAAFSPNGRYIAYQTQKIPTFEADLKRLAIYDLKKNKSTILSENFDNWTQDYQWSKDSKKIYFRAHVEGHFPLYQLDISSKAVRQIANLKTIDSYQVSADNKWAVVSRRTIHNPSELFKVRLDGKGKAKRLTQLNKNIEDKYDIRKAEEAWIATKHSDKKIHTFIIKPHHFNPNKKYPLIINVHGGPQYQWSDGFRGDWQVYPGSGYVVAFLNPHGSSGYGQAFTNAISKDWNGKVYQDVMAVTDYLSGLDYVDEDRMGAMGWSYGGYMMMWLEGNTDRFKALVSMMGVYNLPAMYSSTEELWFPHWDLGGAPWENPQLYHKLSPHNYVKNYKTPCLVITGEKDYRVPYTQSLSFFTDLQKMRVPSELIVFPDDGHWPHYVKSMPFYYNAHLYWFHKYLGGKKAPYDMEKMWRNQAFESAE